MISSMKANIRKVLNNKVFVSSTLISIASVVAGLFNFVFNIIVSRILGQEQYGIIYPLISLLTILLLPANVVQFLMGKDFSRLIHENDWATIKAYLRKMLLLISLFILAIISVLLIAMPALKNFFHLTDNLPLLLVFGMVPIQLYIGLLNGFVQSREHFHVYVINTLLGTIVKFIAGILLVTLTTSYLGVLGGLIASQIVSIIYLLWDFFYFKESRRKNVDKPVNLDFLKLKRIGMSFVFTFFSVGAFQFLNFLDSILVRHYLPDSAGVYSVVNLLGKASFFIATAVAFVMLPVMAKDRTNMSKTNGKAIAFLTFILLGYAVFLAVASPFISSVLFAGKYSGMEKVLPLYGFMFLPYAIISYLVNYYVIEENLFYFLAILFGAGMQAFGISMFHSDLIQVSYVVGGSGMFIVLALFANSLLKGWKKVS